MPVTAGAGRHWAKGRVGWLGCGGSTPAGDAGTTPGAGDDAGDDAPATDGGGSDGAAADAASDGAVDLVRACLEQTPDEPHCKDCCDCAPVGCTDHTPCRDACKAHDFSGNPTAVPPAVPSTLGAAGDYGACVLANADEQTCKT